MWVKWGFTHFTAVVLACGLSAVPIEAHAQDSGRRVVVEPVPNLDDVIRVKASPHSGFRVPRYVSLKFGKVNGRQGPSLKHPALWQYQRRGLPLIVVEEMDIWRKVRDINGDESWMRTQALSGVRNVLSVEKVSLRKKPTVDARAVAVAPPNTLLRLTDCNRRGWCEVKAANGVKGWTHQNSLWGATPLD